MRGRSRRGPESTLRLDFSLRATGSPFEVQCGGTIQVVLEKELEGPTQDGMGPIRSCFSSLCRM